MNWHDAFGLAASVSFLLPVIIILALRLYNEKSFIALTAYYLLAFLHSLMTENFISVGPAAKLNVGLIGNFLDSPLILWFFLFFSRSYALTKQIRMVVVAYIVFEVGVILLFGFTKQAATITLAPGILLNLAAGIYFFFQQTRITITHSQETGKTIMVAALIFAYGCFGLIYIFHYIVKMQSVNDVFLIFHIVVVISSLMMAAGIYMERKKIVAQVDAGGYGYDDELNATKSKTTARFSTAVFDDDDFKKI